VIAEHAHVTLSHVHAEIHTVDSTHTCTVCDISWIHIARISTYMYLYTQARIYADMTDCMYVHRRIGVYVCVPRHMFAVTHMYVHPYAYMCLIYIATLSVHGNK